MTFMERFLNIVTVLTIIMISIGVECVINLDQVKACAAGISTIPPIDELHLPMDRFPSIIPSGVNLCDASCGGRSSCTYNWADSLVGFPVLLFRCQCPNVCPPRKMLYAGYLKILCDEVTSGGSRCICPNGQLSFRCTIEVLPIPNTNVYYCACCNANPYHSSF